MSNEPPAPGKGNHNKPPFLPGLQSAHPNEKGSFPAADETLYVVPGKATSVKHRVLQIWDDMRKRWRAGDPCDVNEYLVRNPDLAASETAAVDLIYAEYLLWEETGKSPQPADFLRRFPQYADALRRQFDVHQALSSESPFDDSCSNPPEPAKPQVKLVSIPNTVGKYRIIESLGGGGQAEVYRAVHSALGKDVVLKLARPTSSPDTPPDPRLIVEGRILAEIEHANLARIYDLDFHQGRPFLVMEYLRGLDLAQYAQQNNLPLRAAAALVAKIARAAGVVHRRGVLHLDIKPQNIVVDEYGVPKLLDFGLAQWKTLWKDSTAECAGMGGTVAYMPPEQAQNDAERIGPRSDVFALGAVLYFLLVGQSPYGLGGLMEVWDRAKQGNYDREALRDRVRSKRLQNICAKALATKIEDRYPSADALAADLESFVRRPRLALALALTVATLVVVAALWFLLANRGGHEGGAAAPGMPLAEDKRSQTPAPSLLVRILRNKHSYELAHAVPVRTHDKLQVSVDVPAGIHGMLLLLGSDGDLQMLANVAASASPQSMAYPAKADEAAPLVGAPGTEVVLAIGWRAEPPDLAALKSLLADGTSWPTLPAESVLQLTPAGVRVEETARNFGDPEKTDDPEGQVRSRLETLRTRLSGKCETYAGLAFSHQP